MNATKHIYDRLIALPVELRAASAEEWNAKCAVRDAQEEYDLEYAAFTASLALTGGSEKERAQRAALEAAQSPNIQLGRASVQHAEESYEVKRQARQMLENEFSALRNLVRLISAQIMLMAAGVDEESIPVLDQLLDKMMAQ